MSIYKIRDSYYRIFLSISFFYVAFHPVESGMFEGVHWFVNVVGSLFLAILSAVCLLSLHKKHVYYLIMMMLLLLAVSFSMLKYDGGYRLIHYSSMIIIFMSFIKKEPFLKTNCKFNFLRFINLLFFVSVLWCIISFHLGLNKWGYFPGQTTQNLKDGLWFRIALFPFQTPPYSAFFSLVVIVINLFSLREKRSNIAVLLALYFFLITPEAQLLSPRVWHTEPEAKQGDQHGQKSGSVPERAQFVTLS